MKKEQDDVSLPMDEFYDSIITDAEAMKRYIERYDDIEKINLYQYVLRKAKALSVNKEENQDMISYCWLASMELEHTEAIQKYLRKDITQEDVDNYNVQKEIEIQQIVELLEQRKKAKRSMVKQFVSMFKK